MSRLPRFSKQTASGTPARIARGWTQKELAKALGTSEQQVQKDEAGAYTKASLEKLGHVAQVLGVSVSGRAKLPRPTRKVGAHKRAAPQKKSAKRQIVSSF